MKTTLIGLALIALGLLHIYAMLFNLTGLVDFKEFLFTLFGLAWLIVGFGFLMEKELNER